MMKYCISTLAEQNIWLNFEMAFSCPNWPLKDKKSFRELKTQVFHFVLDEEQNILGWPKPTSTPILYNFQFGHWIK